MLGQAYEYLIKHFADLTNKKAGEFYTPRSAVHLMGLIIDPHYRSSQGWRFRGKVSHKSFSSEHRLPKLPYYE